MSQLEPTYHRYLQLDRVLGAQEPPAFDPENPGAKRPLIHHDEMLFIVMHQTMELWFKMLIADLAQARDLLIGTNGHNGAVPEKFIPRAERNLRRCAEIMKHLTNQFSLIETMPPLNFLAFRDELIPSSGFQSWQFRELEILAGLPDDERIDFEGVPYDAKLPDEQKERLATRREEVSLRAALFRWMARTPLEEAFPGFVERFLEAYDEYIDEQRGYQARNPNLAPEQRTAIDARFEASKAEARAFFLDGTDLEQRAHAAFVFIATYRDEPLLRWPHALIEAVLEFEEHFRLFRFRHARMVERMIGLRVGSGGSPGVTYLDRTASEYRIFGRLLRATSYLIRRESLPDIPNPEILRFEFEG